MFPRKRGAMQRHRPSAGAPGLLSREAMHRVGLVKGLEEAA